MTRTVSSSEADVLGHAERILEEPRRLLIDGELVEASDEGTFASVSPWSEEEIARVPDATLVDAERAVAAAARAFEQWRTTDVQERVAYVNRAADLLEERLEDFAVLDTADAGSPIALARRDARSAVAAIRRLAGIASEVRGATIPASHNLHLTVREPFGATLRIVAYNHPFMFAATKIAAPLLTGNAVIIKPSELAPLSALLMGEVLKDAFPPGVVQVIVGRDGAVPQAVVRDDRVRRIGFIGSSATGRAIMRDGALTAVKSVTLELGGKNAMIAYPDTDPADVARAAIEGMNFVWSGQSCMSTSRLLLHASMADQVIEEMTRILSRRRVGSPFDPDSEQGAIVSRAQHDRILEMIDSALSEGAVLCAGGSRPEQLSQGLVIAPTILDHVRQHHAIAQTEVFGPVLSVIRWDDDDDPVELANDVEYGLTANIWTNDVTRALTVARRLDVGYVWINGWPRLFSGVPYGGVKNSGVGLEDGIEELDSYTTSKAINVIFDRGE